MRASRWLITALATALAGPELLAVSSPTAAAATPPSIAALATANVGAKACSLNSEKTKGFESSCTGNGGQPEYWCADFAKWVWAHAGVADTSTLNALAGSFYTYGLHYGTLSAVPAVGDAAVFNYNGTGNAEHVALVTTVGTNGTITTVSGDWGGRGDTEAQFASTSSVVLNAPAYLGVLGSAPAVMGMTLSGFVAPVGVAVAPVVGESLLSGGKTLTSGQQLDSPNGLYGLVMQSDGNLVEETGGRLLWSTGTSGHDGARAVVQTDGNLVVYDPSGSAIWASGTGGHSGGGISLVLRDDATLLVSGPTGTLWSRRPQIEIEYAGQSLLSGERLVSSNGLYTVNMQSDGNLVEYTAGRPLWATGTKGVGNRAVMQADGNLVVYGSSGVAVWSSGTGGHSGSITLYLMADAALVVNGPSGPLWSNHL